MKPDIRLATLALSAALAGAAQAQPPFMRPGTAEETAPFAAALSGCLNAPVEAVESTVVTVPGGESLSIVFSWHEVSAERRERYMLTARRGEITGQWVSAVRMLSGEQAVEGRGDLLPFMGPLEKAEALEITALLNEFLTTNGLADTFTLTGLRTSRPTPVDCALLGMTADTEEPEIVLYEVLLEGPARPAAARSGPGRAGFSGGSDAGQWSFWLSRDADGLALREVECVGHPDSCGSERVDALQALVPDPVEPAVREARLQAVLSAVPAEYRVESIPLMDRSALEGRETMNSVVSVRAANGETGSARVDCTRAVVPGAAWSCGFRPPQGILRDPL